METKIQNTVNKNPNSKKNKLFCLVIKIRIVVEVCLFILATQNRKNHSKLYYLQHCWPKTYACC